MTRKIIHTAALFVHLQAFAQLSSLEILGSTSIVNNLGYRLNGTRDILLRFNQKIGWYFSGNLAAGYNVTRFNTVPREKNDYNDLRNVYTCYQLGGNFNLLSAIRTYKKGGKSAVGDKAISLSHFKIYICAGGELLRLKSSDDAQSFKRTMSIYEGFGVEVYRIGRLARQKFPAIVPFFEARYFHNIDGGYYASPTGFVSLDKISITGGFKFTFALPES
jgi:hypothetical protein